MYLVLETQQSIKSFLINDYGTFLDLTLAPKGTSFTINRDYKNGYAQLVVMSECHGNVLKYIDANLIVCFALKFFMTFTSQCLVSCTCMYFISGYNILVNWACLAFIVVVSA